MADDNTIKVGCALVKAPGGGGDSPNWTRWLTCNYAMGCNMIGREIYTPACTSARVGGCCRTGKDEKYEALCSEKEKVTFRLTGDLKKEMRCYKLSNALESNTTTEVTTTKPTTQGQGKKRIKWKRIRLFEKPISEVAPDFNNSSWWLRDRQPLNRSFTVIE